MVCCCHRNNEASQKRGASQRARRTARLAQIPFDFAQGRLSLRKERLLGDDKQKKSGFSRCDMQLKPFLLDVWLDNYEHDIEFNLASSEGPRWTLNEILSLAGEEERQRFLNHKLAYSRPAGANGLRAAIADMQQVDVDT